MFFFLLACKTTASASSDFAICKGYDEPVELGTIQNSGLREASGLAVSRRHEKVLWSHNDHGNGAILFALGFDGSTRGQVAVAGVDARDWEDIATGDVDGPVLFVADTGNNDGDERTVEVLRMPEPDLGGSARPDVLRLRWPDDKLDVEALAWDPRSGNLILVSKEKARARFFRADGAATSGSEQTLQPIGSLSMQGQKKVTAADFAPDGTLYLRTGNAVLVFPRTRDALDLSAPCYAPSPKEPDSEALAALPDGFLTTSEGRHSAVWRVGYSPPR